MKKEMKNKVLIFFLLMNASLVFSQKDSASVKHADSTSVKTIQGQKNKEENENQSADKQFAGISVSPSHVHFSVKPGAIQMKEIKVINDSKNKVAFQIGFSDFIMGRNGKTMAVKAESSKYALSKWLSTSPSYFELKPGESQKVTVTITVPSDETGSVAAWTVMAVDQVVEKPALSFKGDDKTIALGIIPSFGFGIYIYQNPPNVKVNEVEIQKFSFKDSTGKKNLSLEVKNVGDGIGFCSSYVELTSLNTGKKQKLKVKQFTILPGFYRDFSYELPADIPKGKYSAVGVVDFGNEQEIKAAELDLSIE